MSKLVLHVGLHKTGSSAIQAMCAANRDLLASSGWFYPQFGDNRWINHSVPLSVAFMEDSSSNHTVLDIYRGADERIVASQQIKTAFLRELRDHAGMNFIISGEDLSLFRRNELTCLKAFVESAITVEDWRIFIYVRNPVAFALSNAQEWVRAGKKTFADVLALGNLLQARLKIQCLVDVFGRDRLSVFDYDRAVDDFGDVGLHFCAQVGVPIKGVRSLRVNESMSLEKILTVSALIRCAPMAANLALRLIPDDGSRLRPSQKFTNYINDASSEDCDYLANEFGIHFKDLSYVEAPVLDRAVLLRNGHLAQRIFKETTGRQLGWFELFSMMCKEVESWFPELEGMLVVMGYNCTKSPKLKERIERLIEQG